MTSNRFAWLAAVALLCWLVLAFWYIEAENFSDSAVCGTYIFRRSEETSTLILKTDHSFRQELNRGAATQQFAEGTWNIFGEGHIAFSREFLTISGQALSSAGQAYGQIENRFGLISITLAPNPDGPTFHPKWFRVD